MWTTKMDSVRFTTQGCQAFGKLLKKYRQLKGWSLREAEARIKERVNTKLSASTLGDLERAAVTVKAETLLVLSQVGYGGIGFCHMIDILTEGRLVLCENGVKYEA